MRMNDNGDYDWSWPVRQLTRAEVLQRKQEQGTLQPDEILDTDIVGLM